MSIRAVRPGPRSSPPWPGHLRAVPGPAQLLSGPCRASPQATPTAQARAHEPISCRPGLKSTPHSAVPCRLPHVSSPVRRCRVIRHLPPPHATATAARLLATAPSPTAAPTGRRLRLPAAPASCRRAIRPRPPASFAAADLLLSRPDLLLRQREGAEPWPADVRRRREDGGRWRLG